MKPLSPSMLETLGLINYGNRVSCNTYDALVRRGIYDSSYQLTELGRDYVEKYWQDRQRVRFEGEAAKEPIITNDEELLNTLKKYDQSLDIYIYVYRSSLPMLVIAGDGQNPLALLSLYYLWQINNDEAGKFLNKQNVIGWKRSYAYRFKKNIFSC